MLGVIEIQWWHWVGFILAILFFLALDLGVFHRKAHVVSFREALGWTAIWFAVAMLFALGLRSMRGSEEALEFITGYLIELSLSMDNVFVIAVIFGYFKVPPQYQHRVLFWGILGALVMRGLMIWLGAEMIQTYHWTLYVFGVFLIITGIKMLVAEDDDVNPENNPILKLARKYFPVVSDYQGQHFMVFENGRRMLTPMALVLLMVETTDLVFALDSIPAIFAVTTDTFIVFTSNVFAILGLRSLYFVLAGAIGYFRYLKYGLALVLAFIGFKMLIVEYWKIPIGISLGIVAGIILGAIAISVVAARREGKPIDPEPPAPPGDSANGRPP